MAGLSLNVGGYGGAAVPSAAVAAPGAPTVSQRAFGTYTQDTAAGPRTGMYGSIGLGVAGIAVILWLWYSLPR